MKRRDFIKTTALAAPMISLFPADLSGIYREIIPGQLEKRSLGQTGLKLSIIGFGGIVVMNASPEQSSERVKMAIDAGVNYFDVAPTYGDAEIKLGPALEPYRKNVILNCKTTKRTKAESRAELEQSLINLRTDHFDVYQFHAVNKLEEVDTIMGPGGAMETFQEARREGKIRFIGFSSHTVEAAMALMERYDFDTILFPFSFTSWYAGNFGPQVMARAQEKKMGIMALKAMAIGPWPQPSERKKYPKCWYQPLTETEDIRSGLRFTLSHPVTSAVPPGDENLFQIALSLRDRLTPLKKKEVKAIKARALEGKPLFTYPAKT